MNVVRKWGYDVRVKLDLDRIVDAAMEVFAEVGFAGLSMRQVAERLDASAGSLYYHVRNKDELIRLMADRVVAQAYDAGTAALDALPPGAGWAPRVEAQAVALRRSIRLRPGGAVLLAGSPQVLSPAALALMERLQATLDVAGVPAEHRGVAADTVLSHVTGFVLQEQSASGVPAITAAEFARLSDRFPMTVGAGDRPGQDEKFVRSVRLLCAGIGTLLAPVPAGGATVLAQ